MVEFAHPWFLVGLVSVPIFHWWYYKRGHRLEGSLRISSASLFQDHFKSRARWRIILLQILHYIIITLVIIGVARPRIIDSLEQSEVEVVDIVLVLDISSSMLATDFAPNRLEAVKATAERFIQRREGDRLGLLVFAGETFIQCPLTVDHQVVQSLLGDITVAEQAYDGTAIGMAIANATNRLRNSAAKSKVMILLSDGSNNAGELDPTTAADLAAQFGIKIYTIGAGTDRSVSLIPGRGYIKNEVDEATLRQIARRTGGMYFRALDETMLDVIYSQIDQLERTAVEVHQYTRHRELFVWFLIPALLMGIGHETLERFIFRRGT